MIAAAAHAWPDPLPLGCLGLNWCAANLSLLCCQWQNGGKWGGGWHSSCRRPSSHAQRHQLTALMQRSLQDALESCSQSGGEGSDAAQGGNSSGPPPAPAEAQEHLSLGGSKAGGRPSRQKAGSCSRSPPPGCGQVPARLLHRAGHIPREPAGAASQGNQPLPPLPGAAEERSVPGALAGTHPRVIRQDLAKGRDCGAHTASLVGLAAPGPDLRQNRGFQLKKTCWGRIIR